jgi:hypothetical protein
VVARHQEEQQAGASGKRKASSEAGRTDEEQEKHAVLAYVVGQLNEQLFTELMQCFLVPKGDAMVDASEARRTEKQDGGSHHGAHSENGDWYSEGDSDSEDWDDEDDSDSEDW